MDYEIRPLRAEEADLLSDFLYEAIFVPEGAAAPPRSIVEQPELQVYIAGFGTLKDDAALAAEVGGKAVGVIWARIMDDYGHVDDGTPSLAMALYPEYRGLGMGTALMREMLTALMREMLTALAEKGYRQVSLSVQKENYAVGMYRKAGFEVIRDNGDEYIMLRRL